MTVTNKNYVHTHTEVSDKVAYPCMYNHRHPVSHLENCSREDKIMIWQSKVSCIGYWYLKGGEPTKIQGETNAPQMNHSLQTLTCKMSLCTVLPLLHLYTLKLNSWVVLDRLIERSIPVVMRPIFCAYAIASSGVILPSCVGGCECRCKVSR